MATVISCTDASSKRAPDQLPAAQVAAEQKQVSRAPAASNRDLVGQFAPPWQLVEWLNSEPTSLQDLRGQVVFVRFWTNTCPFCERSLPAIQKLADELRDKPVSFVGIYHSKPQGTERPWDSVVSTIKQWGVTFPIAYDREWKTVRSWWLDGAGRSATSASFVIGADGRFVFVHPGPVFYPSDDPAEKAQDGDYKAVRAAILAALAERETAN